MPHRAIYPGTFDPITNGHLDIIERAVQLCDEVIVAVAASDSKSPLLSWSERIDLTSQVLKHLPQVTVQGFNGLLVHFAKNCQASVIIRGLRANANLEYEFQLATMNRQLDPSLETIYLNASPTYSYLSSSLIREIASMGGKVDAFVPSLVQQTLNKANVK